MTGFFLFHFRASIYGKRLVTIVPFNIMHQDTGWVLFKWIGLRLKFIRLLIHVSGSNLELMKSFMSTV
jgi:hypothetical protein